MVSFFYNAANLWAISTVFSVIASDAPTASAWPASATGDVASTCLKWCLAFPVVKTNSQMALYTMYMTDWINYKSILSTSQGRKQVIYVHGRWSDSTGRWIFLTHFIPLRTAGKRSHHQHLHTLIEYSKNLRIFCCLDQMLIWSHARTMPHIYVLTCLFFFTREDPYSAQHVTHIYLH